MDPSPDYDATDEVEYFFAWLPWALRGVYPPPAYPRCNKAPLTRHRL